MDDILALYPEGVKALKEKHGISALVSKWDKNTLKRHAGAKRIDVTEDLVIMLAPNATARKRKSAMSPRKHKPLTNAQLERIFKQHGH